MHNKFQPLPLFVPLQHRKTTYSPSAREKRIFRAIQAGLISFLLAVTVVGYMTNQARDSKRDVSIPATGACQASAGAKDSRTNTIKHGD